MSVLTCRMPRLLLACLLLMLAAGANGESPLPAATGMTVLPAEASFGPVTVFYPTAAPAQAVQRGPFQLMMAEDAVPLPGNGRLVAVSHGSGGSPWSLFDLTQALVQAGFVVAMPEHAHDNWHDTSAIGPDSWKLRPAEVSHAIDAVGRDARFAPWLQLDRVGMYGMSAGGHTALSLAGGLWSPAGLLHHCEAHIAEDFQACVGLIMRQTGGLLDPLKRALALAVINLRFSDDHPQHFEDGRIAAIVASVPYAADFEMSSLAHPHVALGLVTAGHDTWLTPRFHAERVLAACASCERVADLPTGGHGALLSPLNPGLTGLAGDLLNDPPDFDRSVVPEVNRRIVAFLRQHLDPAGAAAVAASP